MTNNSKSFTIVAPYQFGELSDCYYWCKYGVQNGYRVTYIGYRYKDGRRHERSLKGVRVIGVTKRNSRFVFGLLFLATIVIHLIRSKENNVIVCRFPHAELLPKLFPSRNIILDIRTLSVSDDKQKRLNDNRHIASVMHKFKRCSIISEGTRDTVGVDAELLPLGAEPLSVEEKNFDTFRFLYIGTFNNRHIDVFLKGYALFQERTGIRCPFDIVGSGAQEELDRINSVIKENGLNEVTLHGYMDHDEARPLFDKCNIGVCFVPITEYYQYQPPTKLYEYLLSGMVCIATNTISNAFVINSHNGMLVNDNPQSIADGLNGLYLRRASFSSKSIVDDAMQYHWSSIFVNNFESLLA